MYSTLYWLFRKSVAVLIIAVMYIGFPTYNIFLLLNQLIVKRISKKLYFELNDKIYECYHSVLFFYLDVFARVQIKIYGDIEKVLNSRSDNILCLCNHQCGVDLINVEYLIDKFSKLSRVRYVTKEPFQYIPLIGYTFVKHSSFYVKSGKEADTGLKHMIKTLVHLKDNDIPSWIFLFPEGTFYDTKYSNLIEKNVDYCKKIGVEPFKNLLSPRLRALKEIGKHFRNKLDGILDITIVYPFTRGEGGERLSSPSIIEYFSGFHREIEIHVRRIDIQDFPENVDDLENWLFDLYRNKDKLLTEYYSTNKTVSELFNCKPGIIYRSDLMKAFLIHTLLISLVLPLFFIQNGFLIYLSIYCTLLTICTIQLYIDFNND